MKLKEQTGARQSRGMDGGGRQSRLLGRLLGKLRGDHHKYHVNMTLEKRYSFSSTGCISESTGCDSTTNVDEDILDSDTSQNHEPVSPVISTSNTQLDEEQFTSNIDLRYGGQYLTPEQLPEFCNQLHHLVEVIRNIQSYAKVTGEYPSELERRLEQEAREVGALAAEARNARDVVARTKAQRRAVRAQRRHLFSHVASLKETEVRELESTVRLSDRKLYKSWEALKDTADPKVFEPLLEEIKNKQTALECLVRLIDGRRTVLARSAAPPPPPQPLPPPPQDDIEETTGPGNRKRYDGSRRSGFKRRRKDSSREARSVPLSGEPSRHGQPQTNESTSRYRVGSAGAVALPSLKLPSRGSVRDILFFTTD